MFALFLRVLWQFHATEGFVNWAFAKASGQILRELCDGSELGTRGRGELFCIIRAKRSAGSFDELAPSLGVGRWGFLGVGTLCAGTLCAGTQEGKTSPCGHDCMAWVGMRPVEGGPREAGPGQPSPLLASSAVSKSFCSSRAGDLSAIPCSVPGV